MVFSTGNYFAKMRFDLGRSKDTSDLGAVIWLGVQIWISKWFQDFTCFDGFCANNVLISFRNKQGITSDFPLAFLLQNGLLGFGWHTLQFHRKMKMLINSQSKSPKLASSRDQGWGRTFLVRKRWRNFSLTLSLCPSEWNKARWMYKR